MMDAESQPLRIGVLGCGPIAQIAHFDACQKARNIQLYAICEVADDLREKMATVWEPHVSYRTFENMLADDCVDAIIIAVADQFHVPLAMRAIECGKHVFVEKPMGVGIEKCEQLRELVHQSGLVLQVGNNRRFDPGIEFAKTFLDNEMGGRIGFKAWYYDSTDRYTMTDNLQPMIRRSGAVPRWKPKGGSKEVLYLGPRQPSG